MFIFVRICGNDKLCLVDYSYLSDKTLKELDNILNTNYSIPYGVRTDSIIEFKNSENMLRFLIDAVCNFDIVLS